MLLLCDRLDVAGGVERFVCALANHLAGAGFDVAVGSVATPRAALRYALDARVRTLHGEHPLREGEGAWTLLRKQWRTGRALSQLTRQERPDAVLLNGLTTACSVLALDRSAAARTVVCDHNHFDARSRPWRWLRARLYPRVAAVVSLTQADAARFAALNPRTQVIPNASPLQADRPAGVAEPVVLAVGRHVAQKGFDLLLAAWAQVAATLPQARLHIVGDGPLTTELHAQARALGIAGSVQWLAPTPAVEALYRAAAVFVLPSRYEGMPLVLLEAQALGLPAVAFDCPTGPAEMVTPNTGIVVPAGDIAALAAALLRLLGDAELRARMGRAAIERSRQVFGPQQHFQRWEALLRRVALSP